ncbi:MAG: hypothetical protein GC201_01120 [Alphaproteobacteria bacterium]|nr:hypothetical protein [Alphaproteobacteria bacterium]
MTAGGILTLDLAFHLGWAYGLPGGKPTSGHHKIGKSGFSDGEFFAAYHDWLCDMITVRGPSRVCWEAPFIRGVNNLQTAKRLMGLSAITDLVVCKRELRGNEMNVATVKKFFTGNGRAEKADMVYRAKQCGHEITDHNEADALGCWYYAESCLYPQHAGRRTLGAA